MGQFKDLYIPPRNQQIVDLQKNASGRMSACSRIKTFRKEDNCRYCVWCTDVRLYHGNQRYCSDACMNSMYAFNYPQKEQGLQVLLNRQGYKCAGCQHDWLPIVQARIDRLQKESPTSKYDLNEFSYSLMKTLKYNTPAENSPEVDHIQPIAAGGQSLGMDNHQVLCHTCHKEKTKKDMTAITLYKRENKNV